MSFSQRLLRNMELLRQSLYWPFIVVVPWLIAHFNASSGSEVSVFFGLAKYTKDRKKGSISKRDESQFIEGVPFDLRKVGAQASTIDFLGWSGKGFFLSCQSFLTQKTREGCKIRFMILQRDGTAANIVFNNSEGKSIHEDIESMIHEYRTLRKKTGSDNFTLREIDWVTPFTMVMVDAHSEEKGIMSLGLNPVYLPRAQDTRRSLIVGIQEKSERL